MAQVQYLFGEVRPTGREVRQKKLFFFFFLRGGIKPFTCIINTGIMYSFHRC